MEPWIAHVLRGLFGTYQKVNTNKWISHILILNIERVNLISLKCYVFLNQPEIKSGTFYNWCGKIAKQVLQKWIS